MPAWPEQRSGEQQVPGHAGTCGLLAQGSEIAFLGQLVDAEHRFQRTAAVFLEALPLGLGGIGRQFGADEDEQQALRFTLLARSRQQLVEGVRVMAWSDGYTGAHCPPLAWR